MQSARMGKTGLEMSIMPSAVPKPTSKRLGGILLAGRHIYYLLCVYHAMSSQLAYCGDLQLAMVHLPSAQLGR